MQFISEIITSLIFLGGSFYIFFRQKRQAAHHTFFYLLIWAVTVLVAYTILLEIREGTVYILAPAGFFGVFAASYFTDKRRLINGFLFNMFLISLGIYFFWIMFKAESIFLGGVLAVGVIFLMLVMGFGIYALIGFLYWNGLTVLRKESFSLANLLTLLLGIALTAYLLFEAFVRSRLPEWLATLSGSIPLLLSYFFVIFFNFLTVSILYQFNRPKYNQDYIIVLGAGLLEGERVSPLLAGRIDRAIQFYHTQKEKTQHPLKLLMSGGKGSDEQLSEAEAMKNYALKQGIPEADILTETKSTNTLENMRFSKDLMAAHQPQPYKAIFTSNNFHIFRAGLYAKKAQLKVDGIGSKTAGYYLPNAFLREFIAVVELKKKRHLAVCLLILLGMTFLALVNLLVVG